MRRTPIIARPSSTATATVFALAVSLAPGGLSGHGDVHQRIAALDLHLAGAPGDAEGFLERCHLHTLHGDWDAALADCERAAGLAPAIEDYDLLRGRIYLEGKWHRSARYFLDRHLAANPDDPQGLLLRARARSAGGDLAGGCRDYDRAVPRLAEPTPGHYLEQARAHAALPGAGPAAALERIDRGIARLGNLATLQLPAVDWEVSLGRVDPALERLDALMKAAPRADPWLLRRGDILRLARRPAEARRAYQAVVDAHRALPPAVQSRRVNLDLRDRAAAGLAALTDPGAGAPPGPAPDSRQPALGGR